MLKKGIEGSFKFQENTIPSILNKAAIRLDKIGLVYKYLKCLIINLSCRIAKANFKF